MRQAAVSGITPGAAVASPDWMAMTLVLAKAAVVFAATHLALVALAITLFASG
jgi:hypothetical protein